MKVIITAVFDEELTEDLVEMLADCEDAVFETLQEYKAKNISVVAREF